MQTVTRRAQARPDTEDPEGFDAPEPDLAPPNRLRYVPGLDGLRALSVTAVLLYHADVSWMTGGFLGVDVFFVISGYLITSLLLAEQGASGRVGLGRFYLRRARRLLPALFVVLATVSLFTVVFLPDEIRTLRADVVAALGYATNWWQIAEEQSYVAALSRPPLLRHLWSLAVEEQFYLVWPLLLVGMMKLWGGRRRPMLIATGVGIVASFTTMLVLSLPHDFRFFEPSRVYFGSDTRVFTMLLGAALAMVWSPWKLNPRIPAPARNALDAVGAAALVGLFAIFATAHYQSNVLFRGGFLGVAILAAIVIAVAVHPASRLGAVALGHQPLRWIGERSYGIYLWHWPVFMLTRPDSDVSLTGGANLALRLGITLAIAELSYRFIEEPIRHGAIGRWFAGLRSARGEERAMMWQRTVGLTAVVLLAVGLTSVGLASGQPARVDYALRFLTAPETTTTTTTVAPGIPTSAPAPPPQVTAIGDSVMLGAAPALQAKIPELRVDAEKSRQMGHAIDIIRAQKAAGTLSPVVVIHLGTNGTIVDGHMEALLSLLADRQRVVFVNLKVPRSWEQADNDVIQRYVPRFGNAVLINWNGEGSIHPEFFAADGFHLNTDGAIRYADLIAAQINP